MYTIEEAIAEQNEIIANEGEDEHNEHNNRVIRKLPSFRPQNISKSKDRQPSFFARMFSSRRLSQILAEVEEDEEKEEEEQKLDSGVEPKADAEEGREEKAEEKEDKKDEEPLRAVTSEERQIEESKDTKRKPENAKAKDLDDDLEAFPNMPVIGKPTNMDRLITRNRTAEYGMNTLMEMINHDIEVALFDARHIPVGKDADRVTVKQDVSDYMNKVRTEKQIERRVKTNMKNIQKALNYRKSSVIIMNSNYSNQLVRKIEPIYTQEARTIVVFK